LRYFVEFGRF